MREKISKLGPKLVSPKRGLGTGPVLIGKLEPVEEGKEIKENSISISLPSISSNSSEIIPFSTNDAVFSTTNKYDTISNTSNISKREKTVILFSLFKIQNSSKNGIYTCFEVYVGLLYYIT